MDEWTQMDSVDKSGHIPVYDFSLDKANAAISRHSFYALNLIL